MQCVVTHLLHTAVCLKIIESDSKTFDINIKLYFLLLLGSPHFCVFSKIVQITEFLCSLGLESSEESFLPEACIFNLGFFARGALAHSVKVLLQS